jgi:hypothetical protein
MADRNLSFAFATAPSGVLGFSLDPAEFWGLLGAVPNLTLAQSPLGLVTFDLAFLSLAAEVD